MVAQTVLEPICVTPLEIVFDLKGVTMQKSVDTLLNQ